MAIEKKRKGKEEREREIYGKAKRDGEGKGEERIGEICIFECELKVGSKS